MAFDIKGKVTGDKQVVIALNRAPNVFFAKLRPWLANERANMLGGPDAKKKHRKGYRDILAGRNRIKRTGKWSRRITNLFKGHIPFAKNISGLKLKMGILGKSKHQLARALELLQSGGVISSRGQMPVPVYKNLANIGFTGPWSQGSVKSGLKSKAFRSVAVNKNLVGVKKNGKVYYFDPGQRKESGKFERSALMFVGVFGVRVKRRLTGRYDFYARWDRMLPKAIDRGQRAVDRAAKIVERM